MFWGFRHFDRRHALRLNGKTFDQAGALPPHHDEMGSTAVHLFHAAINSGLERGRRYGGAADS